MRVALFIPCYIDHLFPHVGIAALNVLEKLGCNVAFPLEQTCCGQPMANAGFEGDSEETMQLFAENFSPYDYIVAPSGSCVLHVREHVDTVEDDRSPFSDRVYELCEFLVDVLDVQGFPGAFRYRVGLHESCHGLRGLRLGKATELNEPAFNKPASLLSTIQGLDLVKLRRSDECCGFGGTFAVTEEAISLKMGLDRIQDHMTHKAEVVTSSDMSCLMHLDGIIRREKIPVKVLHVAEILSTVLSGDPSR